MERTDFMYSIIESAVKKGLTYIIDHPKRGIRNLLDLGEYFASGRFQKYFFDIAHEILNNEDSFYYDEIENLVKNTNLNNLTSFAINIGYNSFTHGARIIREKEEKLNYKIPWTIIFDFRKHSDDQLSEEELISIIDQGKTFGIYSYIILLDNNNLLEDLYHILDKHSDCAFPIIISPSLISEELAQTMSNLSNVCFLVNFGLNHLNDDTFYHSDIHLEDCIYYLRREGCLYGACYYYDQSNYSNIIENKEISEQLRSLNANFVLMIQKHDSSSYNKEVGNIIYNNAYNSRYQTDSPAFMMDFYEDIDVIGNIISETSKEPHLLSINSFGEIFVETLKNKLGYNIRGSSLEDIFMIIN